VRLRAPAIPWPLTGATGIHRPDSVPKPLTSLIGRDEDVAALRALIQDQGARLVTLTGPGGVGKTRLAARLTEVLAPEFPDGVMFVPLAVISDPGLVLPTIAQALGLRDDTHPSGEALAAALRQKRFLLVLDNFEQVRASAIGLAELLAACTDLAIVVTSRALLRIAGEQRYPVSPLALPDAVPAGITPAAVAHVAAAPAVQLFVARARAVQPAFHLDEETASAVAAICRRLDGVPLAIELAAPRVLLLSPGELLARLQPALPLLDEGPEDAPDRLRTMRAAIAWSHDLLSPGEQTLFRRLSIFVGGFPLVAAEWVAEERGEALLKGLSTLVAVSLLERTETAGETRFGMLETIREFGLEQLGESGELDLVAARHASWCEHFAESIRRSGRLSQGRGLAALDAEHPNFRAALRWLLDHGEARAAQHLAAQLAEYWLRHSQNWSEGQGWLERALAADAGPPSAARAEALVGLSMLQWPCLDFARAAALLAEAEAAGRAVGDAGAVAYARLHRGYIAFFGGDFDLAIALAEESLTSCAAIPQGFGCNGALWLLSRATLERGDDERAVAFYERFLTAALAEGDEVSIANGHYGLAMLAERRGDWDTALVGYAEAAGVCQAFGDLLFATGCIAGAAAVAVELGRMEPAVRLFAAQEALRRAAGASPTPAAVDRQHTARASAAHAALGNEHFAAAWAAGSALSLDAAIAEAAALVNQANAAATYSTGPTVLTPRERDILSLLVRGLTDKEIAAALGIGRRTVSGHVEAVRAKLDAPSRAAAAAIAVRDGLV
jgi:predicted ATPase/DNA-binding CsgD family transcriptional regulator